MSELAADGGRSLKRFHQTAGLIFLVAELD